MYSSDSPIPNLSKHSPFPFFPWLVLSPNYPKPFVVAYEAIMPMPIFVLWFPKL